jgi:hypothetical protein
MVYSVEGSDNFHQWLKGWHESVPCDTKDIVDNKIPTSTTNINDVSSEWYTVYFSYESSADISELESVYNKVKEYCSWSLVAYHSCPDIPKNTDPHMCSINESDIYRNGDIPEYVPSLN